MIATFIVGLVLGLFIGWLRLRAMARNLTTITEQSKEFIEALGKANALTNIAQAKLQGLQLENNQLKVKLERTTNPITDGDSFAS